MDIQYEIEKIYKRIQQVEDQLTTQFEDLEYYLEVMDERQDQQEEQISNLRND